MVAQGLLDFQYEADPSSHGLTSLGGLPLYFDLIKASGLGAAIRRHVRAAGGPGLARHPDGSGGDLPEPCGRGLRGGHRAVGARRRLFGDPARNREGFAVARRTAVAEEPLAARARTGDALAVGAVGLVGAVPRSELAQGGRGKSVHSGGDGGAARPLAGEPGAAGVLARTPAREVGDAGHGRDADRDAQTRRAALLQEIQGVSAAELLVGG